MQKIQSFADTLKIEHKPNFPTKFPNFIVFPLFKSGEMALLSTAK